jgi:hypothetical protein
VRNWKRLQFPKITVRYGDPIVWDRVEDPTREQQQAVAEEIFAEIKALYAQLEAEGARRDQAHACARRAERAGRKKTARLDLAAAVDVLADGTAWRCRPEPARSACGAAVRTASRRRRSRRPLGRPGRRSDGERLARGTATARLRGSDGMRGCSTGPGWRSAGRDRGDDRRGGGLIVLLAAAAGGRPGGARRAREPRAHAHVEWARFACGPCDPPRRRDQPRRVGSCGVPGVACGRVLLGCAFTLGAVTGGALTADPTSDP